MVTLDKPPVSPVQGEPDAWSGEQLRRCTLCLGWRPADEIVHINSLIMWCTDCAVRHPELVPPPTDVLWPVLGFLAGAFLGWVVSFLPAGTQLAVVPAGGGGGGVWCALVGLAAGLGLWVLRAWRSTCR
jgi:hypothetical protein